MTVTHVEVSADMRQAKVHVSVMGDETKQNLSPARAAKRGRLFAIEGSQPHRYAVHSRLEFVLDQGVKKSIEIARILREVLPPQPAPRTKSATKSRPRRRLQSC